ncbi:Endoribonuclease L-PSP/chorismate mutase-like protein [Aspergillus karnatakaensis]|uniref:RidA family protein n=1 Tax=Aspergillus karnatakaensis TaxID=1810916 RepID=UPI003CCC981C
MYSNGTPIIVPSGNAKGLAHYPHARLLPSQSRILQLSGIGSRRPDGTFEGAHKNADGTLTLNVEEQTAAILRNIEAVIKHATNGKGGLENVIDATVFLLDMKAHYGGMNAVWNKTWTSPESAPARTAIGVRELPSPEMIVEIKCTASVE